MNKTKPIIFLLVFVSLGFLFSFSQAQAQKPIPGIKTTAAYKSLLSYVNNTLETHAAVPTTPGQRATYQSTLANRATTANNRVVSLYQQRRHRFQKQNKNKTNRSLAKVRSVYNKKTNRANKKYKNNLNRDERAYHQNVMQTQAIFASSLANTRSQISAQRKKLRSAKNGAQRAAILARIDNLNTSLQRTLDRQSDALNQVKRNHDADDQRDYNQWQRDLNQAKRDLNQKNRIVRAKYKRLLRQSLSKAASIKQSQHGVVSQVRQRGEGYIASMPSV